MSDNIVLEKSYSYALRTVRLYQYLTGGKGEYVLTKEALKTGTDIGAHVKAAQEAETKTVFAKEIFVALRQASKNEYWLNLLRDAGLLEEKEYKSIHADCEELIRLLKAISKTPRPPH